MNDFIAKVTELFATPEYTSSLWRGFLTTMEIAFFAIIIGFVFGLIIALIQTAKSNPWLVIPKFLCRVYVTIIRGTPMALQLFIMFFILKSEFNFCSER